jgi:hypothetical protein
MMSRAAWRIGGASGTVAAVTVLGLFLTSASSATGQLLALELLGRDADRVSRAETAEPDGYTDVHFRVKVEFPQPTTVRGELARPSSKGGRPSASGWLEYLSVEARCGGGPWWTE